jgi:hypothetical protein
MRFRKYQMSLLCFQPTSSKFYRSRAIVLKHAQEQEILEAEMAEPKRIQREAAIEEERLWYEQHRKDYADYE